MEEVFLVQTCYVMHSVGVGIKSTIFGDINLNINLLCIILEVIKLADVP
jgi:hypothetical protein